MWPDVFVPVPALAASLKASDDLGLGYATSHDRGLNSAPGLSVELVEQCLGARRTGSSNPICSTEQSLQTGGSS